MRDIQAVAGDLGIRPDDLTPFGRWKAKIPFSIPSSGRTAGKLVLVTGMTPTPHGEGKTVTSIGLSMGLNKLGRRAIACIRQPSLGPVFGIKGGGAGGGRSTLEPMQDVNLRLTGDFDAVAAAHNLLAAVVDNHIFHGNRLSIDAGSVVWPRTLDVSDRALRSVTVGLGQKNGTPHDSRFIITAASEIMAVLCLTSGYADLKERLGRIVVAYTPEGEPVTAAQLNVVGSMAALLKDALNPNLVQTSEGTPALVHGGPFGNIAHGTCSILSIREAQQLGEYAVVEAGFGSDLGAEKFIDIVSVVGGLHVDAGVIVATVRGLKYQGGVDEPDGPDAGAVERGFQNLSKHIENVRTLGVRPIVAINRFTTDSREELETVAGLCRSCGVPFATSSAFAEGGAGSIDLASLVIEEAAKGSNPRPVYGRSSPVKVKVEAIVTKLYGGAGASFSGEAEADIAGVERMGYSENPVCVAKTANSLSDDKSRRGRPAGFVAAARRVELAAGAGFNIVHMGDITLMPGLPTSPAAERIALSDDGVVSGVY